jgi:thiamine biosynthesis lipoprotein
MKIMKFSIAFFLIFCLLSCGQKEDPYYKISGPTMGTTYNITVQTTDPMSAQKGIDSILADFNLSMSAYIDTSTLSYFNAAESKYCFDPKKDPYFEPIFIKSKEVFKATGGAFNPSIAPLVNYYGFGYKEKKRLKETDTLIVKELLKLLLFDSINLMKDQTGQLCITKTNKNIKLDFNSISPGYAVDVLATYFETKGIINYMIEVGGEIRARGTNDKKKVWVIGINKPSAKAKDTEIELPLLLYNKSLATSGNYRNSYESKGQKFAHIINPFTGLSQPTDILSATIIADDCITADAFATAFMVLGLEKSLLLLKELKGIDACFIYDIEGDGVFEFRASDGFSQYYLDNEQK